jgi:16S rRNA (guanine527-N7)-methyltransferase
MDSLSDGGLDAPGDGVDYPLPLGLRSTALPNLWEVLQQARAIGALGSGSLAAHVWHASIFAEVLQEVGDDPHGVLLDLGSGGGLPGLVLAFIWPERRIVLLDSSQRRTEFLRDAVDFCGLDGRVEVVFDRAETAARQERFRGTIGVVVSRSFGPPAVVAECAAGFLSLGGLLVVSEPPLLSEGRWPVEELSHVGLRPHRRIETPRHFQILQQIAPCPDRYPRRTGVPAKRPLYVAS